MTYVSSLAVLVGAELLHVSGGGDSGKVVGNSSDVSFAGLVVLVVGKDRLALGLHAPNEITLQSCLFYYTCALRRTDSMVAATAVGLPWG